MHSLHFRTAFRCSVLCCGNASFSRHLRQLTQKNFCEVPIILHLWHAPFWRAIWHVIVTLFIPIGIFMQIAFPRLYPLVDAFDVCTSGGKLFISTAIFSLEFGFLVLVVFGCLICSFLTIVYLAISLYHLLYYK